MRVCLASAQVGEIGDKELVDPNASEHDRLKDKWMVIGAAVLVRLAREQGNFRVSQPA